KMKGPFEIVGRLHCIASNAFSLPNRSEPCFFAIWIEVASKAVGCKISGEMGGVRGRRRRITYSNIRISVTDFGLSGHFFHWQTAKMSHVDGVIGVGRIEDDSYNLANGIRSNKVEKKGPVEMARMLVRLGSLNLAIIKESPGI